jgi:hypothetical protein
VTEELPPLGEVVMITIKASRSRAEGQERAFRDVVMEGGTDWFWTTVTRSPRVVYPDQVISWRRLER